MAKAVINGKVHEFEPGVSILKACRGVGVDIPTLCHDERLKPTGSCRMCLVETADYRKNSLPVQRCNDDDAYSKREAKIRGFSDDAKRLKLHEGARVRIRSRYGEATLPIRITSTVKPGALFATFHTAEVFLNRVTSPHRDRYVRRVRNTR